ncbi:MAG TPA: carbohydrate binding family 9 domain-containing protein, partial [Gemmatimonadaceae bacterium]
MIGITALLGLALSLQAPQQDTAPPDVRPSAHGIAAPTDSGATAVHTDAPPVIDGKDDDQVWRTAPVITGFKQWQPTEGKEPRFRTEAKVAYDAANLYVFVRAFDPHPDSIIRILERRDTFTPSDMIWLFVDSFHDRRSGYEFGVNAAGVKMDQAI